MCQYRYTCDMLITSNQVTKVDEGIFNYCPNQTCSLSKPFLALLKIYLNEGMNDDRQPELIDLTVRSRTAANIQNKHQKGLRRSIMTPNPSHGMDFISKQLNVDTNWHRQTEGIRQNCYKVVFFLQLYIHNISSFSYLINQLCDH